MISTSTIWNKLIRIFCSLTLLWFAVPKHDCFCSNLTETRVEAHESMPCCKKEEAESTPDCCKKHVVSAQNEKSGTELSSDSCSCAPERALPGDTRKTNTSAQLDLSSDVDIAFMQLQEPMMSTVSLRDAELQNDVLKPRKLFLLKCALLN